MHSLEFKALLKGLNHLETFKKHAKQIIIRKKLPHHQNLSPLSNPFFNVAPTLDSISLPSLGLDIMGKPSKDEAQDRLRITDILAPGRLYQKKTTGRKSSDQSQGAMSRNQVSWHQITLSMFRKMVTREWKKRCLLCGLKDGVHMRETYCIISVAQKKRTKKICDTKNKMSTTEFYKFQAKIFLFWGLTCLLDNI